MSKIIIIGSSGFVGQNLMTYFEERQIRIRSLSLRKEGWNNELMHDADVIINLVGKAHDHEKVATEYDYYHANVQLAKEVFNAYLGSSARLLIHISSLAAIEEFESSKPLRETDDCNPVTWYGKSKRTAEEWLLIQRLPKDKKLIILRPPMIHGPGDKGNLGLLYKLISKGIPYPLASFDNRRSFISIDNFMFFVEGIIGKQDSLESGVYHIADDQPVSTKEIIAVIKDVTGKNTIDISLSKWLVKIGARLGDFLPIPLNSIRLKKLTSDLLVSNKKIKQELNINELPLTANAGIRKTIESFQNK